MLKTLSPIDGSIYFQHDYASSADINTCLDNAKRAQRLWQTTTIEERATLCRRAVEYFLQHSKEIATEITWQMGRPLSQAPGELKGLAERAHYMIDIAAQCLQDISVPAKENFTRFMRREPWGVAFIVAPWNFPYLTTVNSVIPAIMAGNSVVLKPSSQTPLTAERFAKAFAHAGLPEHVFQYLLLDHAQTEQVVQSSLTDYIAFTGSVKGGQILQRSACQQFKTLGLELGGKDPAYVCEDADLTTTVANVIDGAFFNSGQSCCGIERIYVAESCFDDFVGQAVELVKQYQLGNPLDEATTLGPVVRESAADFIRGQIQAAVAAGAKTLIPEHANTKLGANYLTPQILIDVNHQMAIMSEETFGPVVGIMPVKNDAEAIQLMNDSAYGLTASIWTRDKERALTMGAEVEAGTWFMNRCDYLDPALAWTGVKNTGRGVTLSALGYEQLTRVKSYHLAIG